MATYTYSIATDTANAGVAPDKLADEIANSSIVTSLDNVTTNDDVLDITFTAALSAGDQTTLTNVVNAHDGVPYPQTAIPQLVEFGNKTPGGTNLIATKKADGVSFSRVSHDFTDKTTWYPKSTQVTGETLTFNTGTTYSGANTHWIDVLNGKIYREYELTQYIPKVYDNGVEQTSGYTIDYIAGTVTFDSAPTGPVTCDYYYGDDATWTLEPDAGKYISLEHSELQFAKNIGMPGAVNFEIWVYNPLFNPANPVDPDLVGWFPGSPTPAGYNPLRFLYKYEKYKNIKDIINTANLGQGFIPACGGLAQDVLVFPFNYVTEIQLLSSQGAQLRITLDNNAPFTGEWGTVTFYCLSEAETP